MSRDRPPNEGDGCISMIIMLVIALFGRSILSFVFFIVFFALVILCGGLSSLVGA